MIPKKIHYCWFGGNPLSEEVKRYIASWKKYCPDYEIIEWNESNFDVTENAYCKEAYEAKKWAFVSDYARLKVLHDHGGFYMDADVEVVKSLDPLRVYDAVSGYESQTHIATGTMGACRDNEWISMLLSDYDDRHFLKEDGTYDLTTNVEVITRLTVERYHLQLNGAKTMFGENMVFLPFDYLCAKSLETGEILRSENTFTIHHFAGSWLPAEVREWTNLRQQYVQQYMEKSKWIILKLAAIRATNDLYGKSEVMRRIGKHFLKQVGKRK